MPWETYGILEIDIYIVGIHILFQIFWRNTSLMAKNVLFDFCYTNIKFFPPTSRELLSKGLSVLQKYL